MKKHSRKHQHNKIPKSILITGRILSAISKSLVTRFAVRLFTTPVRHRMPKREWEMDDNSRQRMVLIPAIDKEVLVYEYGRGHKKVLLVHGWSGRGTQLVSLARELSEEGYQIVSFDAPAHGRSQGERTVMLEFIATILHLQTEFGPFEAAVGHSLGGMSLLNAASAGLDIKRLVTIGSADVIKDIVNDFVGKLQLKPEVADWIEQDFNRKYKGKMGDYSSYLAAQSLDIPVLVVHDRDDREVPVSCAIHIHKHLKDGHLLLTDGLGHRKILGSEVVVQKVVEYVSAKNS